MTVTIFMGWTIGMLPIFIFLWKTQSFTDFLFHLSSLKDISIFAKIPFPPSLKYFENVFILAVKILSIISILKSYKEKSNFKLNIWQDIQVQRTGYREEKGQT